MVLLMACLTVANLLLAKAVSRRREWALRTALGAGRAQVGRLVMIESLAVALIGGMAGIGAAALMHRGLVRLATNILPRTGDIRLDLPVLLFGVALSLVAGVVFGAGPVLHVLRHDPMATLRETAGVGAGKRAGAIRAGLVGMQMALVVPMLIGAALLLQSLRELEAVDAGFDPRGVTAARLFLDNQTYPDSESRRAYFRDLLERLRVMPGVIAAGASSGLPLDPVGIDFSSPIDVPGRDVAAGASRPRADHRVVTPGYLEALGLPLIRGRFVDETDRAGGPRAIVINEALANQLWPGEVAVGRRASVPFFGVNEYVVVGIVGNVRFRGLAVEPRPEMYTAHDQGPFGSMTVAVRTNGDAQALIEPLRQTVLAMDARQPVHSIVTADQLVAGAMSAERFYSVVSLLFAFVALALAAGGLYGVMAYAVRQRTREIGVLLALGARPRQVTGQIVRRGLIVAGIGAAAGVALAIATTRALQGVLYGVVAADPAMIMVVLAVLLSAALLASYVPARHAARIDPVRALRQE
jgi:putative ABC transport system permease protein